MLCLSLGSLCVPGALSLSLKGLDDNVVSLVPSLCTNPVSHRTELLYLLSLSLSRALSLSLLSLNPPGLMLCLVTHRALSLLKLLSLAMLSLTASNDWQPRPPFPSSTDEPYCFHLGKHPPNALPQRVDQGVQFVPYAIQGKDFCS